MDIVRKEILPGIFLSCITTNKFKSDCLSVSLLTQLERGTVAKNALLPRVLARGCRRLPTMEQIAEACDELYGAKIIPVVRKKGEILAMGFYAGFINDRYTPEKEQLLEPVTKLLCDILIQPTTKGGLLRRDYVDSEKQKLVDDIRALKNDKEEYAVHRLIEEMFAYEDYGNDDMGTEEAAASVNYVDLTKHYRELLQTCPVEFFYCGSAKPGRVGSAILDALSVMPRGEVNYDIGTDIRMNTMNENVRTVEEESDVIQAKLVMGFRMGDCMDDPNFAALRVFNTMYGSGTNSRLFLNVREKLSLCYYAYSELDSMKGIMITCSGVDCDKISEAQEEMLRQLEEIRSGNFTDEELETAKATVVSGLTGIVDGPGALENYYLNQTLLGLDESPENMAELCRQVTREDIIELCSGIALDTVYYLTAESEEEE